MEIALEPNSRHKFAPMFEFSNSIFYRCTYVHLPVALYVHAVVRYPSRKELCVYLHLDCCKKNRAHFYSWKGVMAAG
jgi:hypothetical protein